MTAVVTPVESYRSWVLHSEPSLSVRDVARVPLATLMELFPDVEPDGELWADAATICSLEGAATAAHARSLISQLLAWSTDNGGFPEWYHSGAVRLEAGMSGFVFTRLLNAPYLDLKGKLPQRLDVVKWLLLLASQAHIFSAWNITPPGLGGLQEIVQKALPDLRFT